jgi:hypothetical protein
MRKCGYCGKPGHNRRTCPKLKADKEAELAAEEVVVTKKPKKKRVRRCTLCGEEDHTAKNCPYKPLPADADIGPKRMECGHWSWWHRNGECELCTKAIYFKQFDDEEEKQAA